MLSTLFVGFLCAGVAAGQLSYGTECSHIRNKCDRQKCVVRGLYNNVAKFNLESVAIVTGDVANPYFHPNITGRVAPLGTFDGTKASTEYFMLAGYPSYLLTQGQSNDSRAIGVNFQSMVCEKDEVSVIVDVELINCDGVTTRNLSQQGVYRFDCCGRLITSYDLNLLALAWSASEPEACQVSYQTKLGTVCSIEAAFCHGDNAQFVKRFNPDGTPDITECLGALSTKEDSNLDRATEDNMSCRFIHSQLVPFDPDNHCFHIGFVSTKCLPRKYEDKYLWEFKRESCTFRDYFRCYFDN